MVAAQIIYLISLSHGNPSTAKGVVLGHGFHRDRIGRLCPGGGVVVDVVRVLDAELVAVAYAADVGGFG